MTDAGPRPPRILADAGVGLRARFADDISRGLGATVLHCDSQNPTGATRAYEQVGMRVDQEVVAFHRPLVLPGQRRNAVAEQSGATRRD